MPQYIVSACLAGIACRYDGGCKPCPTVQEWVRKGIALPLCPETLGGLPAPRLPCEIQADGRVRNAQGEDHTAAFERGAHRALALALQQAKKNKGCHIAVLKSRSPSCGVDHIYDGSFTKTLRPGLGLWAQLLRQHGFTLYSEEDLPPNESAGLQGIA